MRLRRILLKLKSATFSSGMLALFSSSSVLVWSDTAATERVPHLWRSMVSNYYIFDIEARRWTLLEPAHRNKRRRCEDDEHSERAAENIDHGESRLVGNSGPVLAENSNDKATGLRMKGWRTLKSGKERINDLIGLQSSRESDDSPSTIIGKGSKLDPFVISDVVIELMGNVNGMLAPGEKLAILQRRGFDKLEEMKERNDGKVKGAAEKKAIGYCAFFQRNFGMSQLRSSHC